MKKILPKWLTRSLAESAVNIVSRFVQGYFELNPGNNFYIVIIVPAKAVTKVAQDGHPIEYSIKPYLLYEESIGSKKKWTLPLDKIARSIAYQLWDGSSPGGSTLETPAHLLYPGLTPYWGGDKMEGIVVACSGVQPWYNKMISRLVLSLIIGIAKEDWETSEDKMLDRAFLMWE